jgi:hypothetical protein
MGRRARRRSAASATGSPATLVFESSTEKRWKNRLGLNAQIVTEHPHASAKPERVQDTGTRTSWERHSCLFLRQKPAEEQLRYITVRILVCADILLLEEGDEDKVSSP